MNKYVYYLGIAALVIIAIRAIKGPGVPLRPGRTFTEDEVDLARVNAVI